MSDDGAAAIYCTYGQCADATVPCPRCSAILVGGESEETITYAELQRRESVGGEE
jgi:hypothetical protein